MPEMDELLLLRKQIVQELTNLLDSGAVEVDNSPPLSFGFSIGYHFMFHGIDDTAIKELLYRVYVSMCPALLQGFFIEKFGEEVDSSIPTSEKALHANKFTATFRAKDSTEVDVVDFGQTDFNSTGKSEVDETWTEGTESEADSVHSNSFNRDGKMLVNARGVSYKSDANNHLIPTVHDIYQSGGSFGKQSSANMHGENDRLKSGSISSTSLAAAVGMRNATRTRIGFVSRFMDTHPVGLLCQGLIEILANSSKYDIFTFIIDGENAKEKRIFDRVLDRIILHSKWIYALPKSNIALTARMIRSADIDVLIFPEIGIDPVSYFLSFSRLAKVQAAWLGHPDTTGIKAIDYFISSDCEVEIAQKHYTEKLVKMKSLGTKFLDMYAGYAEQQLSAPRTILLDKAKFTETIGIPKNAHLYVIGHSLSKLHQDFDAALLKILMQDRIGYLLVIDVDSFRPTWQKLFVNRLVGKYSNEVKDRILLFTPSTEADLMNTLLFSTVMLEPFPVSGNYKPSLEALAIGLPVVTMPSEFMGGRLTLALYNLMGYEESSTSKTLVTPLDVGHGAGDVNHNECDWHYLIVKDIGEYVNAAIKIAHQQKLRGDLSACLLRNRDRLFNTDSEIVLNEWNNFTQMVLKLVGKKD